MERKCDLTTCSVRTASAYMQCPYRWYGPMTHHPLPSTPRKALKCWYTLSAWNIIPVLSGPTKQACLIKRLILSGDFQIFFRRDEFVLFLSAKNKSFECSLCAHSITNEGRSLWYIRPINDDVWRFQTIHWRKRTFGMCLSSFHTTQVAFTPCHHNSVTHTHTHAAPMPEHAPIYTHVLQNSEKGRLTIVLGQRDKFKEHRHVHSL